MESKFIRKTWDQFDQYETITKYLCIGLGMGVLDGNSQCMQNKCQWQTINKGRFCNTIASVALVHTSIQSDWRIQTKEILSNRNSKRTKPQSCLETSTANSRLVRATGGFWEKVCAYNERKWVNLKFCLADFVYLIQELRSDCVHLSNKYAKIVMLSARFLNQIDCFVYCNELPPFILFVSPNVASKRPEVLILCRSRKNIFFGVQFLDRRVRNLFAFFLKLF